MLSLAVRLEVSLVEFKVVLVVAREGVVELQLADLISTQLVRYGCVDRVFPMELSAFRRISVGNMGLELCLLYTSDAADE